jgi:chemotaxis protein histidine kinase CheA
VPRFALRAGVEGDRLFVSLRDPGSGVDWDALRTRAAESGLAHGTKLDLIEALFTDGVSTAKTTSDTAGRGVGLSAVRAMCERRNGTIDIVSERGAGSTFRFSWPVAELKSLVRFEVEGLS